MFSRSRLWLLCLSLGLFQVISASPLVAPESALTCSARNLAIVKRTVSDEVYFCKWWQADTRTRTPFLEFTVNEVNTLCKCISPIAKATSSKHKRAEPTEKGTILSRSASSAVCSAEVSKQFTEPWHLCTFFNAYPRTTSPFRAYNAKELKTLCDCVLGKAVPSTSKKTTTSSQKTSTISRKPIQSSTRLSSSTKKPLSSTTKSSSSTKKSSSSIKTSLSTSHKSPSGTSKAGSTNSKLINSSAEPSSSSKSTLSIRKASTSSKPSSSTSKTILTSSRASTTSTSKSASSPVTTSGLVSSKISSSIPLPSLIMKTSSSTSSIPPSTITSSSRLVSSSTLGANSTTQISSSTDSSSTIDGLPTIAASSIPVPEFTSTSISCDDVACARFAIGASTTSILGAAVTDLTVTPTTATTSIPEFTATTISCDPLMGLLCVSLAIGPSTTSTIGTVAPDGSNPTGSSVQPTTTETSATSSSVPTTTTSTSSACTPLATSCGSNGYFSLMAVSNDSSINGQYASVNGVSIAMCEDSSNAQGFCLDSNNDLVWAVTDGYAAVKSSSRGPIQVETQGNPLSCTAVPNEDCTATLQCTWYNDFRMVVDKSYYNAVYLTDDTDADYGGSSNPVPVTLIMQTW